MERPDVLAKATQLTLPTVLIKSLISELGRTPEEVTPQQILGIRRAVWGPAK